jgi:hypothetical protein
MHSRVLSAPRIHPLIALAAVISLLASTGLRAAPTAAPMTHAKGPAKVVVMDVHLDAQIDAALGPYLTQLLASEVGERRGVPPLVSTDIRALLGFQETKRNLGCDEESERCIAELAGAMGVDEVVQASVSIAGNQYLVSAVRIDAHRAQPLARYADSVAKAQALLVRSMRAAAAKLFADASTSSNSATSAAPVQGAPIVATDARSSGISRRQWALITGSTGVILAGIGAGFGIAALNAVNASPHSDSALARAHTADILYGAAAISAGAALWLWLGAPSETATSAAIAPAQHGGELLLARSF